jgi:hypothetical protein
MKNNILSIIFLIFILFVFKNIHIVNSTEKYENFSDQSRTRFNRNSYKHDLHYNNLDYAYGYPYTYDYLAYAYYYPSSCIDSLFGGKICYPPNQLF